MAIFDPDANAVNENTTVGNTSTAIVSIKRDRKFLFLCNDSDETIYVALSSTAVMNKGIRLNASGGSVLIDEKYTGAVSAICSSGSKVLTRCEG